MAPDLNSLPPSRSPNGSPFQSRSGGHSNHTDGFRRRTPSPSSRTSTTSLAAAATINAGIQHQDSRRSSTSSNRNRGSPQIGRGERRRSNVLMNDSILPASGEYAGGDGHRSSIGNPFRTSSPHGIGGSPTIATGDPHHQRAPSLGELHQELEEEQEAQVNRLLQMIRQQQMQIQQMQQTAPHPPSSSTAAAVDDSTPTSERSFSFPVLPSTVPTSVTHPRPRSPVPRTSFDLSYQPSRRSRTSSRIGSPALRPLSAGLHPQSDEWLLSGGGANRDETAFYQAETQMLNRENQMLRMRIRELERQVGEGSASSPIPRSNVGGGALPSVGASTSALTSSSASQPAADHQATETPTQTEEDKD